MLLDVTMTMPVMLGWMLEWNVKLPAELKVRPTDTFNCGLLTLPMLLGAPATESKMTVSPTVPNTQVTVSPELIVTDDGENAKLGSAWILVSAEFCGLVDM